MRNATLSSFALSPGRDFTVPAGRTLLLSCSSSKPRQRWFHRQGGQRWEAIFTRFRNGSVKAETDKSGLSFENDTLQIQDLQPGGAGEYMCNEELQARVRVLAGSSELPELSGFFSSIGTTDTPAAMATGGDDDLLSSWERWHEWSI